MKQTTAIIAKLIPEIIAKPMNDSFGFEIISRTPHATIDRNDTPSKVAITPNTKRTLDRIFAIIVNKFLRTSYIY